MSDLKLRGTIKKIGEVQSIKEYKKMEFLLETESEYPQVVKFEIFTKKDDGVSKVIGDAKEGDVCDVYFNVRGSEWKEKHYVSLSAWRVDVESGDPIAEAFDNDEPPF